MITLIVTISVVLMASSWGFFIAITKEQGDHDETP